MGTSRLNEYNPDVVFHPGETLQEKLEELNVPPKEFSIRTGKPEKTISRVLHGKSSITPDMAVLFETVLGIPASFWLRKQSRYDEFLAREKRLETIIKAEEWLRKFPYNEMRKLGWVADTRIREERISTLLTFFGVALPSGWYNYFLHRKLKATFRISLSGAKDPYALSAWLRHGELESSKVSAEDFDLEKVKAQIGALRKIMAEANPGFRTELKYLCSTIGIKVIYTPALPRTSINGVSRWIDDSPVIQLSNRWKRYDIFWFTFFHELGHILMHSPRFVSLENVEYDDRDQAKEEEANQFAAECVFSKNEYAQFRREGSLNRGSIVSFAEYIGTHPSCILGRLAHDGVVSPRRAAQMQLYLKID